MNKVILIGRLTKDPEVRYSQSAEPIAIARYTLAVNRRTKKEGEPNADFIGCVSFGRQAEFTEKYFKKGMQIAITGRINVYTIDDAQTGQRQWRTDIVVEDAEFTESRSAFESRISQSQQSHYDSMASQYTPSSSVPVMGSDPMLGGSTSSPVPEGFAAITESIDDDDLPF
ncbi:MAG: single-stranded DNA-binding protein [Defluviitaleaceae bacterium]|nr:single-stranded DNA-binding protein [Defluviitaleaceae bacterium]